jgi:hypothetical protein
METRTGKGFSRSTYRAFGAKQAPPNFLFESAVTY